MRNAAFPILLTLSLLLGSCSRRSDVSDVVILLEKTADTTFCGAKVNFLIRTFTINSKLTSFKVSSFDPEHGGAVLLDVEPNVKEFRDNLVWEAPQFKEELTQVLFYFKAADNLGNLRDIRDTIYVKSTEGRLLQEHSGVTVYSASYGSNNGFSLKSRKPVTVSEEEKADIVIGDDFKWTTATDAVFVKSNTYSYPDATPASVRSVLLNSVTAESVSDIQADDIILIGRKDAETAAISPWGVIKIAAIYKEAAYTRYIFNYKYIDKK